MVPIQNKIVRRCVEQSCTSRTFLWCRSSAIGSRSVGRVRQTTSTPLFVELTPEALSHLCSLGTDMLTIGDAVPGARVALVQYPRGELSFGYGAVEAVEPPDLYYHIGADCGSSGSPVLDWEARAIGIHKRADKPATPMAGASVDPLGYRRFATSLREIVYAYLSDRRISLSLCVSSFKYKFIYSYGILFIVIS